MDITPLIPKGRQVITGYGDGGFKINQEHINGSVLIFSEQTLSWDVENADAITFEQLEAIFNTIPAVELLLIGTGESIRPLDSSLRQVLKDKHIALEIMDTGAACRTYNVLLSEERRVAAALIAV